MTAGGGFNNETASEKQTFDVLPHPSDLRETLAQLTYCIALAKHLVDLSLTHLSSPPK